MPTLYSNMTSNLHICMFVSDSRLAQSSCRMACFYISGGKRSGGSGVYPGFRLCWLPFTSQHLWDSIGCIVVPTIVPLLHLEVNLGWSLLLTARVADQGAVRPYVQHKQLGSCVLSTRTSLLYATFCTQATQADYHAHADSDYNAAMP